MEAAFSIRLNDKFYLRDPESTELGRKIVGNSIKLIESLGFRKFTFKKLADEIHSTEASIYRYFPNKQKLLIYLVSWYWAWLEYRIQLDTSRVKAPAEKLKAAIMVICNSDTTDENFGHIQEDLLYKIVVLEGNKAYFNKQVDENNREGLFSNYKSVCRRIAGIITDINENYAYPHTLASTMIEMAQHQLFFAEHLSSLTDIKPKEDVKESIAAYLEDLAFKAAVSHR